MALDRIRPLKLEDPSTGGTELDKFPSETEPNEDYVDCRGVVFQSDTSDDETVRATRDASGNMMFYDQQNEAGVSLSDATAGGFAIDRLLITTDGGIIYDNGGVLVVKVAP